MRKVFVLFFIMVILFLEIFIEKASVIVLINPSLFLFIILGVLFSTLFSHNLKEVRNAMVDSFNDYVDFDLARRYRQGLLTLRSMESYCLFWAFTLLILSVVLILSDVRSTPEVIGRLLSIALLSTLYGIGLRVVIVTPMRVSLERKLLLCQDKLNIS